MLQGRDNLITAKIKHSLTHSTHLTSTGNITAALLSAVIAVNVASPASANPAGENIKHGIVSIDRIGSKVNINQSSDKAIIEWDSFSIGASERTEFKQPNANAVALNRVVGDSISNIQGRLTSNGKVILVNPNGVLFDSTSIVNVGSLIATTADIADQNFIDGNYNFSIKAPEGSSVVNKSTMMTIKEGGVAAFVAPVVQNDGIIYANAAKISLAGSDSFAIDLYGDGLVNLEVQSEPKENAGLVENNGQIVNPQGTVALTTAQAQNIVSGVVNMGLIKQAESARIVGSSIILDAGNSGAVDMHGKLSAAGESNATLNGGSVTVKGGQVDIRKGSQINASGALDGNGGEVLVTSGNTTTTMDGRIYVNSGSEGGAGGLVDISGKEFYLSGTVEGGEGSTILIDPTLLYIANGNDGMAPALNTVYEEWIESQSASGANVVLTASELIQLEDLADNEITGGTGSISLLANEGGSTTGAIRFVDMNDAIATTEGDIILEAGSGGIDVGNLRIEGGASAPGMLHISTVNNGAVSAQNLLVQGTQDAMAEIAADGAVSIGNLSVLADGADSDVTATATISSANSSVEVNNLTVGSFAQESAAGTTSSTATASANISAAGDVQLLNDTDVSAFVAALENKAGDTLLDATANASLNVNAGQDAVTHNVAVQSAAVTTGNAYKTTTATANASINAADTVTTTGDTSVMAISVLQTSDYASLTDVTAASNLDIAGDNGVTTNGSINVTSGAGATGTYAHNISSDATATLVSENGDIAVNGPVSITSDVLAEGAVPIDVVVEFIKHNADYRNTFGTYNLDSQTGEIRWADLSTVTPGDSFTMRIADLEKNGFFLIPDGAKRNSGRNAAREWVTVYDDNDTVTFQLNQQGFWDVYHDGKLLKGADGASAYFSTIQGATGARNDVADGVLNADGVDHAFDGDEAGNSNWEDKFDGTLGSDFKGDANFNITYTAGEKASAHSNATFTTQAKNGDVAINGDVDTSALLDVRGNGYDTATTSANVIFEAGENIAVNGNVESVADTETGIYDVDTASANAEILMTAQGKTGIGNVAINGDLTTLAYTTNAEDTALSTIRADAADNIVFGDTIADPLASTSTQAGVESEVQGRVTMQQTAGNDTSRLIFNAQQDVQNPGNPGGENPGGETPGGETPGGETPGGETPGGETPGGETPGGGTPTIGSNALNQLFIDPLQRFLLSLRDAGIVEYVGQRPYTLSLSQINLSLLGGGGTNAGNLSPEQLGSLAPAAGGMATGDTTINCANSYLDNGYGAGADTASCGDVNQAVN